MNTQLEDVFIPILRSALKAIPISTFGFSLKQGIQDSSDTYYIDSISFTVSLQTWSNWLPSGILSTAENASCTVYIFQPSSTQPQVGFECGFPAEITSGNSEVIKLPCKATTLPVLSSVKGETSGYSCTLTLSTSLYNQQGENIGLPKLTDIMSAFGFGTQFKDLTTTIPVVGSFLQQISLKSFEISYNTSTKVVTSFYLLVLVPKWTIFEQISLSDFELELQYSEAGGWEASLRSDVILSEIYYITLSFSLPSKNEPGVLSFDNPFEGLTVAKLFSLLGLPALGEIPVLGSILSITVKEVELGFETSGTGLGLYGVKVQLYIQKIDLQVFQITDVDIFLAYSRSEDEPEISYTVLGFINEVIYIELAYDPSKSKFKGHFEVTTNRTLTVDSAVDTLLGKNLLMQNTAYNSVAAKSSATVEISLAYKSFQKSVSLEMFRISLENIFEMNFGSLSLSHFSLEYTITDDNEDSSDSSSQQILPSDSRLELKAVLLQRDGQFGLQLSFDCTISDARSNTMTATIQPFPGKKTQPSLISFPCWG